MTRAAPGAEATAARLRDLGWEPLVAPLVRTRPLAVGAPDLLGFAALAFTSATGVGAFAASATSRDLPVFAVGGATARAAREAGWREVRDADGDGRALAALIAAARPSGEVLAPGAAEPAFDLAAALAPTGVLVTPLPVYRTEPITPAPPDALAALAEGALAGVLTHSPSAARALDATLPDGPGARGPWLLALSDACRPAAPGWRTRVAAAPRERDLLALLAALDGGGGTR